MVHRLSSMVGLVVEHERERGGSQAAVAEDAHTVEAQGVPHLGRLLAQGHGTQREQALDGGAVEREAGVPGVAGQPARFGGGFEG